MSIEEKHKQEKQRKALISKWPKRLEKLRTRAKNPLKESEFCDKYGFGRSAFNRAKNLKNFARQSTVDQIEAAFESEGV